MLLLQHISYIHPDKDPLFEDIHLNIYKPGKVALIGNNGAGKSTLLKIMAGALKPSAGVVQCNSRPYYIPQLFGQFNHVTIADALGIEEKLNAYTDIINGNVTERNLALLNDDWRIEERCQQALNYWNLQGLDLSQRMERLSGGEKTKVFLAGITIHEPEIILMDEPSNHLDHHARQLLYDFVNASTATMVIVSHDRKLLNLLDEVYELTENGITVYGGNYDFYAAQKLLAANALSEDLKSREKALRKAKETARETMERQQKLDARGKKKKEKAGVPTIAMNTLRNNAEQSTSRMKNIHAEKVEGIAIEVNSLRAAQLNFDKMKIALDNPALHKNKILFTAEGINYGYGAALLWQAPLYFQITSAERIQLKGSNGSGKTSLIKIILGELLPKQGKVNSAINNAVYIDQDYSLINNQLTVYQQAEQFNVTSLAEHEIKIRLNRFLFTKTFWDKPCGILSGGEKMRLMLCCLTIRVQAPDIIILDEPTNNLDIQNIEILTEAIKEYKGSLLVVSHDEHFVEQLQLSRSIELIAL